MAPEWTILDFETRSPCDISAGADNYAGHPETEVICLGWRTPEMDHAEIWWAGQPLDIRLAEALLHAQDGDTQLIAVNANFDRLVYEYICTEDYAFPVLPSEAWYCMSAECRAMALPGGLEKALLCAQDNPRARGKDPKGGQLIKACCIPPYDESVESLSALGVYCARDVDATWELMEFTRELTPTLLNDYHVNERINDRGVKVDLELATLAQRYAEDETVEIGGMLATCTNNVVTKHTQSQRMREWVRQQLAGMRVPLDSHVDHAVVMDSMMVTYKSGEKKYTLDKATRADLLNYDDEHQCLPPKVRTAIEMYDAGNASSVSKFKRMTELANPEDHRVRGAFIFAGAGQTLRFSAKGLQLHNFPRKCLAADVAEEVKLMMLAGAGKDALLNTTGYPTIMQLLAALLRPALIPEKGNVFVVYDWSAIEARVLPWLAGSNPFAKVLLDLFRNGEDVYKHEAAKIFRIKVEEVDDGQRQTGKVAILSLGFGGAEGALAAMARNYGMSLSEMQQQKIVRGWRQANPWATEFWYKLMKAFTRAYRNPDKVYRAGRVGYQRRGPHVYALLPCGTELCYLHVKPDPSGDGYTYVKGGLTPKADAKTWPRRRIWHGILAENATQAVAASALRWALREMEDTAIPVVAHTHDEVISEVPAADAEGVADLMEAIMTDGPEWAEGLPLAAEGGVMSRYGK